jgi:hypothetical protein
VISPNVIGVIKLKRMGWAEHVPRVGKMTHEYNIFVEKPDGKIPLGRPRRRWEDNNIMDLKEIGCEVDWTHLTEHRDLWRAVVETNYLRV